MSGILTMMWKEIRDNLRDKRSLFFALIYGPLLMPALMIGPIVFNAGKHIQSYDTGREIHVYGEERAPNLLQYLKSKNIDAKPVDDDFKEQIVNGDIKLVVEVSETYGDDILEGSPAKVTIHYDKEEQESQSLFWQVRGEIDGYGRLIAAQRMSIRGFDQNLLRPIDIAENDLSEEEFGAGILANIIMFLVIFSSMMGGFYLAIDITAGERERNSLEPLLSLALTRTQIALGKYLTILCFCVASFVLPVISVAIWAMFLPEKFFGNADIPGLVTYLKLIVISLPISILMAGFLMVIAAYSKSTKEAQTQMGIAMFFPMAPFFVVQFLDVKADSITNAVPILSQYLLADKIMMDATHPIAAMLPGAASCLLFAAALLAVSIYLYKQDSILGS